MCLVNCIDISESVTYDSVKALSLQNASHLLPTCADFRS